MTYNFCAGVCASSVRKWDKLSVGNVGEDVRVMTRKNINDPGEPSGVLLSAATSVWMPITQQRLFDFLRDERMRSQWDILSNGGPMQEVVKVPKGPGNGNCVSLLRSSVRFHRLDSLDFRLQISWIFIIHFFIYIYIYILFSILSLSFSLFEMHSSF